MVLKLSTAILSGGKSRRMGCDKAQLLINSTPFIIKLNEVCQPYGEVLISVSTTHYHLPQTKEILDDPRYPNAGPLGGIYSALMAAKHEYLFVCGVDMPFVTTAYIDFLTTYLQAGIHAVVVCEQGKRHPLGAIYHKSALPLLEDCLNTQTFKLQTVLSRLKLKEISLRHTVFEHQALQNINTPAAYRDLVSPKLPVIFAVSGVKNSGKTTLISKLIRHFTSLGYGVGTVKHEGHDRCFETSQTDTTKHLAAGSLATLIYSNHRYQLQVESSPPADFLQWPAFSSCDIIILEGLKHSQYPKIEVLRAGVSETPVCSDETLFAIATNHEAFSHQTVEVVPLNEIAPLVNLIKKRFLL